MSYTGTTPKDLDLSKPDGASEYANILDDAIIEVKKVVKYAKAINIVTDDTTLDATHSFVIANKATAISITLPTASDIASSTFTKEYRVRNIGAGTCTVVGTVNVNGVDVVNQTLAQYAEIYIYTDGTTYYGITTDYSSLGGQPASYYQKKIPYVRVSYTKTAGTHGGTASQGAYNQIVLNSEDNDADNICTLTDGKMTLPAGTYRVHAAQEFYGCGKNRIIIYDVTNSATLVTGVNGYAHVNDAFGPNDVCITPLDGEFTLTDTTDIALKYRVGDTLSGTGLGLACSFGDTEIYSVVELWKVA